MSTSTKTERSSNRTRWRAATQAQRGAAVSNLFVPTPVAQEAHAAIDRVRLLRSNGREPTCVIITGDSGVGKSEILKQYRIRHPSIVSGDRVQRPIVLFSLPQGATPREAAKRLMRSLLESDSPGEPSEEQEEFIRRFCKGSKEDVTERAKFHLRAQNVEAILCDEFQHVAERGTAKSHSQAADWVKDLVKTTGVPIVMCGIPTLENLVKANRQLLSLTQYKFHINVFSFETGDARLSFRRFVKEIDDQLPFEARARLGDFDKSLALHMACRGNMRILIRLIQAAADRAIAREAQMITVGDLSAGFAAIAGSSPLADDPFQALNP